MTKRDGYGNRYELLVHPVTKPLPGFLAVRPNNRQKAEFHIDKSEWEKWEQVADCKVEQGEMF